MQQKLSNPLYMMLYQLVTSENPQHILEVGSASGEGSTAILAEAIRGTQSQLYCLEAEPERHAALTQRYAEQSNVHTYPYLSVYPAEFLRFENIEAHWQAGQSLLKNYPLQEIKKWYDGERALATQAKNVSGIAYIQKEYNIEHFDMVLLDGAEFLGDQDYEAVRGTPLIVLDDTQSYKNQRVLEALQNDPDYYLLYNITHWQHGCATFKKKRSLEPGISAVIHTRNEENVIVDAINSLGSLPQEIIIVDMYSDDRTLQKIKDINDPRVRVVSHVPTAGVDMARNFGLSQVSFNWTLVLDADERLTTALYEFLIQGQQELESTDVNGLWLARKNYFFGVPVDHLFPDYQMRFFKSYKVNWPGGVHQYPVIEKPEAQLNPDLYLEHYSYENVSDFVRRQQHYAEVFWHQQSPHQLQQHLPVLQKNYTRQVENTLHHLDTTNATPHEWLVRHLYLFSELCKVSEAMEKSGVFQQLQSTKPRLSAYSYLKNGILFDYPFRESLLSILSVCDEVIVTYATDSDDQTQQVLENMQKLFPHLKIYPSEVWKDTTVLDGKRIALAAQEAESYCSGDWLWHVQADEVYSRKDAQKVKALIHEHHYQNVGAFLFPIYHFYGDYQHLVAQSGKKLGWYMSCVRLTRRGAAHHIGDAWTQKLNPGWVLQPAEVTIFHYGHVREPESMRLKSNNMEKLYKKLPDDFEVCKPNTFVYDRVPQEHLELFQAHHPLVMARRISDYESQRKSTEKKPVLLVVSRLPGLKKGYGITMETLYRQKVLQNHFEVHHLAWHYHEPSYKEMDVTIHPDNKNKIKDPERLQNLIYSLSPDVILLHADLHYFSKYEKVLEAWKGPVVGWFTVDYEQTKNPRPLRKLLQRCDRVIGLADFGIEQLKKDYTGPVGKVPLGVDTHYFKPVSQTQKSKIREKFNIPDHMTVFLTVANNFWRKGIEYAVESFGLYCQNYPEAAKNSCLYLHTEKTVELLDQIEVLGLNQNVLITPDYDPMKNPLSVTQLAEIYQMSDIFLLTTLGEGFGMTLLEAQACGLPVIVSNNSVIKEVTQNNALYIPCPGLAAGKTGGRLVWMKAPDITKAAEMMLELYQSPEKRFTMAEKALADLRFYDWKTTAYLLNSQLVFALGTGKLLFDYPQPKVRAV